MTPLSTNFWRIKLNEPIPIMHYKFTIVTLSPVSHLWCVKTTLCRSLTALSAVLSEGDADIPQEERTALQPVARQTGSGTENIS